MLLFSFTSAARSFGLKKLGRYIPITYWEGKVSTGFARLNIGVAFSTIFRNSSFSGMSPKKVTITQSVLIVLIIENLPGKIP